MSFSILICGFLLAQQSQQAVIPGIPPSHLESVTVPRAAVAKARVKAELIKLLRESIYEDSMGIRDPKRDARIQTLVHKLIERK